MKGWKTLFIKDWKLVFRNRLLLAVLLVYPFLIMGIIGAAFYDAGRPVPIGVLDLDRVDPGGIAWVGMGSESPGLMERRFRRSALRVKEYESDLEASAALERGEADLLFVIRREDGSIAWEGGDLSRQEISDILIELQSAAVTWRQYASCGEALDEMESGMTDIAVALREDDYPYIGESIWLEGESYDASSLIAVFGGDVTEIREYGTERDARDDLKRGRIDAVIVLPSGFVHALKTLDEVARVPVIIDQSNLVKAEFAETSIRGFLSEIKDAVVENKTQAVVAGLYTLVTGGDFFGTEVVGLELIKENLETLYRELEDRPDLLENVETGIGLADTVINDIEDAAAYLRGTALPIELDIYSVAGRTLSAKDAVVPALIALSILWTGVLCGAILMVVEEEEGMRIRLGLTGMGAFALVGSKLALATAIVFAQSSVMLVLAVALFGVFASNAALALLVIAAASFSCIGIGLVIAAFARQVAAAVILSVLVSFPLVFMTGAVYPLSQMPVFMQVAARVIPVTYAIEALSGVMLRGETITDIGLQLWTLFAFGLGLMALGSFLVRRRAD